MSLKVIVLVTGVIKEIVLVTGVVSVAVFPRAKPASSASPSAGLLVSLHVVGQYGSSGFQVPGEETLTRGDVN